VAVLITLLLYSPTPANRATVSILHNVVWSLYICYLSCFVEAVRGLYCVRG